MESKTVSKKVLYIGSAIFVTVGMGIIKGVATVINAVALFLL